MAKLQNVLVSYDGSPHSKEALHWAIYFGRHSGANITAVKVFEPLLADLRQEADFVPPDSLDQYEQLEKQDQQLMADANALGRRHGIEIATQVLKGKVAESILAYAKAHGMDMIITGNRGHGVLKQLLVGSVTRHLVSLSPVPVLVVKNCPLVEFQGGSLIMATLRKILVAYDGSPHSKDCLAWAIEMARPVNARITALKVRESAEVALAYAMAESGSATRMMARLKEMDDADASMMKAVKETGQKLGIEIATQILEGNASQILMEQSQKQGFDLIVAGARGYGIIDRLPIGTVAHNLISVSPVPVLVVKT
jgi:nucleotide-binding universal stress UspA family protein